MIEAKLITRCGCSRTITLPDVLKEVRIGLAPEIPLSIWTGSHPAAILSESYRRFKLYDYDGRYAEYREIT